MEATAGRTATPLGSFTSGVDGSSEGRRLVIAHKDEKTISRRHAFLEPLADGRFRLTNRSNDRRIGLPDGKDLKPQERWHGHRVIVEKGPPPPPPEKKPA